MAQFFLLFVLCVDCAAWTIEQRHQGHLGTRVRDGDGDGDGAGLDCTRLEWSELDWQESHRQTGVQPVGGNHKDFHFQGIKQGKLRKLTARQIRAGFLYNFYATFMMDFYC